MVSQQQDVCGWIVDTRVFEDMIVLFLSTVVASLRDRPLPLLMHDGACTLTSTMMGLDEHTMLQR